MPRGLNGILHMTRFPCLACRIWGIANKEAPLRICFTPDGRQVSNVELKACDATINPYIMLTAVLRAGLWGLHHGSRLPPPVQTDPSSQARVLAPPHNSHLGYEHHADCRAAHWHVGPTVRLTASLVLSCLVLSCLVLSCLVLSCLVLSCLILSCLLSRLPPPEQTDSSSQVCVLAYR